MNSHVDPIILLMRMKLFTHIELLKTMVWVIVAKKSIKNHYPR